MNQSYKKTYSASPFLPIQALKFFPIQSHSRAVSSEIRLRAPAPAVKIMTSVCISSCVEDARVPVRATYSNLYKWPESDAEFVKSVSRNRGSRRPAAAPGVVDSISCRQMYLRSYSFSKKKETVGEKTKKCLGRVKERVASRRNNNKKKNSNNKRSFAAFFSIFHRLLSCTAKVDVVDGKNNLGFGT